MNPLKPTFGINPPHFTKPSAPFGNLMKPTYMIGNVAVEEPRRIVPAPKGIYDLCAPLPKNAYFTNQGVRQHVSHAFGGGNLPVPEGGKAKYSPKQQILDEQSEDRVNEFLGRYMTISEEATAVLRERFAMKDALRDAETYQQLIHRGLTDAEAGDVIRQRFVEKASSAVGQTRMDFHQRQKDAIADLALSRKVRVGLPQSMATFAGVNSSDMNYSQTEIAGIKRLLKSKIEKVDNQRKAESQIGQNFNAFPKAPPRIGPASAGWVGNVPSNYVGILPAYSTNPVREAREGAPANPVLEAIISRARGGGRAGRLDIDGSPRVPGREPVSAEEFIRSPAGREGIQRAFEGNLRTLEDERPSREDQFEALAGGNSSASPFASSSSSAGGGLRPATGGDGGLPLGERSASGGAGGGAGRGRPPSRSAPASSFDYATFEAQVASTPAKDRSKVVQRQAIQLGISIADPDKPGQNKSRSDLLEEILRKFPPDE